MTKERQDYSSLAAERAARVNGSAQKADQQKPGEGYRGRPRTTADGKVVPTQHWGPSHQHAV